MITTRGTQAGSRLAPLLTLCLLISTAIAVLAPAAVAFSMNLSSRQGLSGARVSVTLGDLRDSCRVLFDATPVVSEASCPPGTESVAFNVPSAATPGDHQVVVISGPSQISMTFKVVSATAPAPPAPAPAPPAPAPPAPAPPAPAPTTPMGTPTPTQTGPTAPPDEPPGPTPPPGDECDIQPSAIESLSVSPLSGPPGGTATVAVGWSPTAGEGCPEATARIRVNGEEVAGPITVGGPSANVEIDIPEELSDGPITISVMSQGQAPRALATTQFSVEADDGFDEGVSPWLLVAAGLTALVAGVAVQQLYSRKRARFGRQ